MEKRNTHESQNGRRHPVPTLASLLSPANDISYLSRTVKAVCWQVRICLRYMKCEE